MELAPVVGLLSEYEEICRLLTYDFVAVEPAKKMVWNTS